MNDKPILFSAPMVRAILEGRKTMTRRVLKPQPEERAKFLGWLNIGKPFARPIAGFSKTAVRHIKVRYAVGDQLWVREAWRAESSDMDHIPPIRIPTASQILYEANGSFGKDATVGKLRPSIHMPRWASRILLKVTAVKIERLQDISEEDAKAEGVEPRIDHVGDAHCLYTMPFNILWTTINGPGSWEANPWVAAYSFEVVKK